jgi:hypothetical protein
MVIFGRNTKTVLSIWAMSALLVDGTTFKYQGLRRDYRATQTFDASFLHKGFCSKICDKICLSLGTESCTGICNHQCNSEVTGSINVSLVEPGAINQSHSRTLAAAASSDTCSPSNVRSIRIESTTGQPTQMFELQAYTAHTV